MYPGWLPLLGGHSVLREALTKMSVFNCRIEINICV